MNEKQGKESEQGNGKSGCACLLGLALILMLIGLIAIVWIFVGYREKDPFKVIVPPFDYSIEKRNSVTLYVFEEPRPPLAIRNGTISAASANIILESVGIPPVKTPGKNIEQHLGGSRYYRPYYIWKDPEGLVFRRTDYGSQPGGVKRYDSLKMIIIGENDIRELVKYGH